MAVYQCPTCGAPVVDGEECRRCAGDPLVGELARLDWTIEVLDRRLGDIRREFAGLTERRKHAAARRAVIAAELQRRLAQPAASTPAGSTSAGSTPAASTSAGSTPAGSTSVPARSAPAPTGFVAPDTGAPSAAATSAAGTSAAGTSVPAASAQAASTSATSTSAASTSAASVRAAGPAVPGAPGAAGGAGRSAAPSSVPPAKLSPAGGPGRGAPVVAGGPVTKVRDRGPETSTRSVQNVLLTLGGLLLGTASIIFTVVAWAAFGQVGRALILVVTTAVALAVPVVTARLGLTATAETIAAVGLLLVLLDGYAAWSVNLVGVRAMSATTYAGLVCAAAAAAAAAYRIGTHLVAPQYAALLAAQPVLPLLVYGHGLAQPGWAVVTAVVALFDLAVAEALRARVTRRRPTIPDLATAARLRTSTATGRDPARPRPGTSPSTTSGTRPGTSATTPDPASAGGPGTSPAANQGTSADRPGTSPTANQGTTAGRAGASPPANQGTTAGRPGTSGGRDTVGARAGASAATGSDASAAGRSGGGAADAGGSIGGGQPDFTRDDWDTAALFGEPPDPRRRARAPMWLRESALVLHGLWLLASVLLVIPPLVTATTLPVTVRASMALLITAAAGVCTGLVLRTPRAFDIAAGAATAGLLVAVVRTASVAVPGYALVFTAAAVGATAFCVRLLPAVYATGPAIASRAAAAGTALVVAVAAVVSGTATAIAAWPPWRADLNAFDRAAAAHAWLGWQLPVTAALLTAAGVLLAPRGGRAGGGWRGDAASVGAATVALAVPGAFGVAWWLVPALDWALLVALGVAALAAPTRRSATLRVGAGLLVGAHGAAVAAARPGSTAVMLGAIAALCVVLGAWGQVARAARVPSGAAFDASRTAAPGRGAPRVGADVGPGAAGGAARAGAGAAGRAGREGVAVELGAAGGIGRAGAGAGYGGAGGGGRDGDIGPAVVVPPQSFALPFGPYGHAVADAALGGACAALPGAAAGAAVAIGVRPALVVGFALVAGAITVVGATLTRYRPFIPAGALIGALALVLASLAAPGATWADAAVAGLLAAGALLAGTRALGGMNERAALFGPAAATAGLIGALARVVAVVRPGFGMASTAALVLVVALGVRLLARSSRPGPTLGAATVGGAVALVAGGIAVADGLGVLVAAASPPWRTSLVRWQEVAAGSVGVYGRYGWQVPVALIMLAATAWLLLGQWPEIAAGGAGLAALAVPAAFGLPWWAPVAVGVVAGGTLGLLATLAHTPRGARAYATAGALLGLHGVGAGLARPAATALALAGIMAAGTAVAGMALRPVQTLADLAAGAGPTTGLITAAGPTAGVVTSPLPGTTGAAATPGPTTTGAGAGTGPGPGVGAGQGTTGAASRGAGTSGVGTGPGRGTIGIGIRPRPRARPAIGGAATIKARTKVGGAAVTGALFAAPGATAALFAALNLPGRVIVQAAMATVAATLGAAAVLRLARTPYVAHAVAGVGAGAAVVAFSTLPAGEPVGPYGAVAGLIGIGAGLLLLPAPVAAVPAASVHGRGGAAETPGRARPEPAQAGRRAAAIGVVGASALPVFAAVGAVLPGLFSVLALPYGWLPKIWTGSPTTTRNAFPIGHWYGTGWDAMTLLLLTAAAALVAVGLGGSRWVPAATLPPAAAALLVLPAAANLPWPAGPAVAAVVSLSAGLTASLVRAPESRPGLTTYRVGMAVCGLAGGAGMAGSLATVPMTLAGLATAVGGGLMVALVGRYRPARISGWLLASLAALVTPIVAGAAVRRSGGVPPPDAYGVLAVAALLIGVATLLSRQGRSGARAAPSGTDTFAAGTITTAGTMTDASARRIPESRAVEWCGYAGAALAVLRAGLAHSAVQAAVVLALWGILLGLTASRADRTAVYRAWLVRAALVSEVLAWWLFAQQSDVTLWEAYTLPFALLALIGGILELRANPELNSWVAYGPALAAAFGPSLALILVETDSPTGRIRLVGIAVGAVLVVVLGGRARRQAPVLVGGVTLLVTAGRALVLLGQKVQWWILFGALGLVLVWVGATYERRRHDMRRLSARLKDMS